MLLKEVFHHIFLYVNDCIAMHCSIHNMNFIYFQRAFVLSKGTVRFREGVKNLFADLFVKRVPGTVHPSVYGINLSTETVYGFGGISCPCLQMEIFKKIAQQPFSPKKKTLYLALFLTHFGFAN